MKRIIVLIAAASLTAACSDRAALLEPALYSNAAATSEAAADSTNAAEAADVLDIANAADAAVTALDDILERIVPSLGDNSLARVLERALNELRTDAAAANRPGMAERLTAAHQAVERFARANGDDAELEVIRMALDFARLADPRAP